MKKGFLNLVQIAIWLVAVWLFSQYLAPEMYHLAEKSSEPELALSFLKLSFVLLFSYLGYYVAHGKSIPTFVSAILLGMAAAVAMEPIIGVHVVLVVVSGLGATYILFGGGYDTKWADFKRLFMKIFLLATVGVVVSAVLFSAAAYYFGQWFGVAISIKLAVLLGVSLASTDPAAIIPMLKSIVLKNSSIKDIIICESALNDVVYDEIIEKKVITVLATTPDR
jgi:cell volume regulation protein A